MSAGSRRAGIIRRASLIALAGNGILMLVKIGAGVYSESLAVIGDGIDTSMDVLISIMTLIVSRVISKPADKEHPWGHGRAETVATTLLSFLLFFAGIQLVLKSAAAIYSRSVSAVPSRLALFATVFSIGGKLLLALSQYRCGKQADSAMLRANAKNMASDVVLSAGVLAGLGLSIYFRLGTIDQAAAILVGLWVIRSAVGIFLEVNAELMDGGSGQEFYRAVFEAVHSVEGAGNPHRTRMRRIAGLWDIDIDIEVNPDLSVRQAHRIASRVETAIKERVEGVYDIMVHVEPTGDSLRDEQEGYGLKPE
ncbi:MAG: cation diffusion facilitator family transporter [Treponema sp.]|jgi:cation diffusion facilitator family transporter|nr:cation diffusion facilitator family transporter [Treponema sp.]